MDGGSPTRIVCRAMNDPKALIYHLARGAAWRAAREGGVYRGTPEDRADGFMHFSTAGQVAESAAKHRAGETDLILLGVDPKALGAALKWEPSRGGRLFPHLYGDLPVAHVAREEALTLGADGRHRFPPDLA